MRFGHKTAVAQKNAVLAEDLTDFREGDRVMTVDGFPGKVTAVLFGPYQGTESYQVELDHGMGGGDYGANQLYTLRDTTASVVEAAEVTSSVFVEGATGHTANNDYPELEDILERRLPNENLQIFASVNTDKAGEPDSFKDDPGQNLEQQQKGDGASGEEQDLEPEKSDQALGEEEGENDDATNAKLGDVTPPSACSYCGGSSFGDTQMTGRGVRVRCDQCGGTMKSWGGQWEPEFPNSSQNNASGASDYRSGGVGGIGNAPGAKPDSTSPDDDALDKLNGDKDSDDDGQEIKIKVSSVLQTMSNHQIAESLQSQAGIVQYLFNRMYEKARKNYEDKQIEWWQPPVRDVGPTLQGPAQYHTITPKTVTVGSVSEYDDPTWQWHFTASWADVQAKARRIRKDNHVRIVAASKMYVNAEVQGDHSTYETHLNYVPGTRKVADWSCGCKWASYAWGRSKRYQRFEGRLCSHALATQYEASSRGIFGREVAPDHVRPDWQNASTPIVVQYDKAQGRDLSRSAQPPVNVRRTFSSLVLDTDGIYPEPQLLDLQHAPVYASVQTMIDNKADLADVIEMVASVGVERDDAQAMLVEALLRPADAEGYSVPAGGAESGSTGLSATAASEYDAFDYGHEMGYDYADRLHAHNDNMADVHPGNYTEEREHHVNSWINREHRDHVRNGYDHGYSTFMNEEEAGLPHRGGSLQVSADYSTADPLAGMDAGQMFRPKTMHSTSENPGSTGWATSQDPGDWGQSLISNNFGVTFDAALHTATEPMGEFTPAAEDHLARLYDSTLHGEPEGALPSTDGAEEEIVPDPGAGNTGSMPGDDVLQGDNMSGGYDTLSSVGHLSEEQRIVAEFQRTAGAKKLAMKDFSFEEQQELINEGRGARARNFTDLKIAGTHYELLGDDDVDETVLWI